MNSFYIFLLIVGAFGVAGFLLYVANTIIHEVKANFAKDKCAEQRHLCAKMYKKSMHKNLSHIQIVALIETADEPNYKK